MKLLEVHVLIFEKIRHQDRCRACRSTKCLSAEDDGFQLLDLDLSGLLQRLKLIRITFYRIVASRFLGIIVVPLPVSFQNADVNAIP